MLSKGNDAIVQIKANQGNLLSTVKSFATFSLEPTSRFSEQQRKKRNRIEYREVETFTMPPLTLGEWAGLFKTIIRVRRYTDVYSTKAKQWKLRAETSYYGCTCSLSAEQAATYIRTHWHIENRNHYVRDVSLGEDASRIRKNPGIFARLRSFSLNLLRKNHISNVKEALFENALNFDNLLNYHGIF